MPYKNDPRRTVTLNLPPAEYAALAADAARAGHPGPGPYALSLVRARGAAAFGPLGQLRAELAAATRALAACRTAHTLLLAAVAAAALAEHAAPRTAPGQAAPGPRRGTG